MRRTLPVGLAAVATLLAFEGTPAQTAAPAQGGADLVGLWGAEPQLGPQVHGRVLVTRHAQLWSMRVGGFEVGAPQQGDSVVLALPGGQGALRLWLRGTVPEAYWVQPPGMNASFATPVRMRAAGRGAWQGDVRPIVEQFPLYLMIARDSAGVLRGRFRNPAANWPGQVPYYDVHRQADTLTFINPRTGRVQWRQAYDSARRSITFDFGASIVLTPRTMEQATGFVTRSPALPEYRYRRPADLADGWRVQHAATARFDTLALQTVVRELVRVDPLSETAPRIHALLVARRGQLVLDEYFRGYDADMPHDLRSAAKTMTSIMVGAAMHRRAAISSRTPIDGSMITVGHLLSHSSGKACDDDDDASPGNEDTMQSQQVQNDWYAFFMALPSVHAPGTKYGYCSAGVNMAGKLLRDATSKWLPRLFDEALAQPMQFGVYGINLMPGGEAYSAGGMHVLPRDLLKFGQLYLDGGVWRGRRLVNAEWVRESTAHRISRPDGSDDGLGWHRHLLTAGTQQYQTYEASGNGGQFLIVVPALHLAVVVTAGNYGQYGTWQQIREKLVPAIMAAAR